VIGTFVQPLRLLAPTLKDEVAFVQSPPPANAPTGAQADK